MIEDPEFTAALERHRAEIRAEREAQDARLAEIIDRFSKRGTLGNRYLKSVPAVPDFKLDAAGDR